MEIAYSPRVLTCDVSKNAWIGGGANHGHCVQFNKMQNHSSLRAHLHIPMIIAYGGSNECASPQIIMKWSHQNVYVKSNKQKVICDDLIYYNRYSKYKSFWDVIWLGMEDCFGLVP